MKHNRLWQCIIPSLLLSMLLTSCGNQMTSGPGTAEPTPNSTSSAPATNSPKAIITAQPQEACTAFLPSTPCTRYTSVSGTTSGKELPWVASRSVKTTLTAVNGELQL